MLTYPTDFPADSADSLAKILLSMSIKSNVAQFGLDVWNLQGYLQGKVLGTGAPVAMQSGPPITREECITRLESAVYSHKNPDAMQAFNWSSLLPVVRFALQEILAMLPTS